MIQTLTIRNIVLIEHLTVTFHTGMQVLTGETGAGKSIVVDAVNLILGNRADRSLIRTGCEQAVVEAVFDVPDNHDVEQILQREGIEYDGRTVTVYREMTSGGKNLCRVCGIIVSVALLKEIGSRLMDIHGQHEHQFLMNPEMHIHFLDRLGDEAYRQQLKITAEACEDFLTVHRKYAKLRRENDQKQRRMAELEEALRDLREAKLKTGEEEVLQTENARLRNAEKIVSVLQNAKEAIAAGDNEPGALGRIRSAFTGLSTLNRYGEDIRNLSGRCESIYYELEEIVFELGKIIEENDYDPGKLEKNEDRLDLIRRMERKYGENLEAVLAEQKRMEEEYETLCSLEDELSETARTHRQLLSAYRQASRSLSEKRKALASEFEKQMMTQLKDLGMEKTVFRVVFQEPEEEKKLMPRPLGDDRMEFMISPNPGEALKPLAKIASGGELSRLMLAMKTLEAEGNGTECMVFDEIDTGISGRMAQAVSEKMISISRKKQVISVTHLPQIAAAADYQFVVSKEVKGDRTRTSLHELDYEGRIHEVARMISGAEGSVTDAEAYARSMIEASEKLKNC